MNNLSERVICWTSEEHSADCHSQSCGALFEVDISVQIEAAMAYAIAAFFD